MATPVYWNNLNATNDWADPLNWSLDDAGSFPLAFFDGTEYFLWTGTGPGALDACTLSNTSLTCAGLSLLGATGGITISILGSTVLTFTEDDVSTGYVTADLLTSGALNLVTDVTITYAVQGAAAPGSTYTIKASGVNIQGMNFDASGSTVVLDGDFHLNVNNTTLLPPVNITAGTTLVTGTYLTLGKPSNLHAVDSASGAAAVTLSGGITVYNCDTVDVWDPAIVLTVAPLGPNVAILNINRGPQDAYVPQWAIDHTDGGGDLALDFSRLGGTWPGTDIAGEWQGLDLLDGCTFDQLSLGSSVCGNSDQVTGYRWEGATPITITCAILNLNGGHLNTTATRYYSFSNPVTIDVTNRFDTSDHGNIQYGLRFPSDHLQCTRFYAPGIQGWDGLTDDRDISLVGSDNYLICDFSIGVNAWVTDLNAVTPGRPFYMWGRPAFFAAPGSDSVTLQGKLNLPDNDLRFRCIPDGTYRINLATGVDAASVVDVTGAILPIEPPPVITTTAPPTACDALDALCTSGGYNLISVAPGQVQLTNSVTSSTAGVDPGQLTPFSIREAISICFAGNLKLEPGEWAAISGLSAPQRTITAAVALYDCDGTTLLFTSSTLTAEVTGAGDNIISGSFDLTGAPPYTFAVFTAFIDSAMADEFVDTTQRWCYRHFEDVTSSDVCDSCGMAGLGGFSASADNLPFGLPLTGLNNFSYTDDGGGLCHVEWAADDASVILRCDMDQPGNSYLWSLTVTDGMSTCVFHTSLLYSSPAIEYGGYWNHPDILFDTPFSGGCIEQPTIGT